MKTKKNNNKFKHIENISEYNKFVDSHLTKQQQEELISCSKPHAGIDNYHIGEYLGFKYKLYNECLRKKYNLDFNSIQEEYIDFIYYRTSMREKCPYDCYKFFYKRETLEDIKHQIELIQKAISYFTIKENIITYRFCSKKELKILKFKKIIKYPCFLSTTMLPKKYKETKENNDYKLIKIYVPKNSKGLPTPTNTKEFHEFELLFPYHSKLIYLGTENDHTINQKIKAFLLIN